MVSPKALWSDDEIEMGCAYILDEGDARQICGIPRRPASPYCLRHHALCHVAYGSAGEADCLREVEALAKAVGGRRSRAGGGPSRQFLKRLERVARFSCE
jgi:hypothetical protein